MASSQDHVSNPWGSICLVLLPFVAAAAGIVDALRAPGGWSALMQGAVGLLVGGGAALAIAAFRPGSDFPAEVDPIPLPLATAGIGMVLFGLAPGGWSALQGLFAGLLFGFGLSVAIAALANFGAAPKLEKASTLEKLPKPQRKTEDGHDGRR